MHSIHTTPSLHRLAAGFVLLLIAAGASAQQIYRQVDKNGKVTFSDRAPTAATEPSTGPQGAAAPAVNGALPYELRQIAQRYPVTLYTGDDCDPCSAARSLLTTRGVPFSERTVKTNDDIDALQRLSGTSGLPLLAIGSQQLKGYSDSEWSQYLDAAGYPKSNSLPAGYRNPAAQPLVALKEAPAKNAPAPTITATPTPQPPPPPASGPTPNNPAGIKF